MSNEIHIEVNSDADIVVARQQGRMFANELGFFAGRPYINCNGDFRACPI